MFRDRLLTTSPLEFLFLPNPSMETEINEMKELARELAAKKAVAVKVGQNQGNQSR